jgi:membrane protein insertase Oxa1/YidC/SpoIIIJ
LISMPIMFAMFGAVRILSNVEIMEYVFDLMKDPTAALPSAMWVRNIWQPDTGTADVMPALAQFNTIFTQSGERLSTDVFNQISTLLANSNINQTAITAAKLQEGTFFSNALNTTLANIDSATIKAAASMNYNALIGPILAQHQDLANGYFVFPVLAGASMFLSTWLPQHIRKKENSGADAAADPAGSAQGFMLYIMPLLIIWISTTTAVPFSIYYIASSAFSILQFFFLRLLDKRKKPKVETGQLAK